MIAEFLQKDLHEALLNHMANTSPAELRMAEGMSQFLRGVSIEESLLHTFWKPEDKQYQESIIEAYQTRLKGGKINLPK